MSDRSTGGPRVPFRRVDGLLLLDKPEGISSNAALQRARRALRAEKAGHTGTLDPFATGLLPLCLGDATKFSAYLLDAEKTYLARLRLGAVSTTGDPEGEITSTGAVLPDADAIDAVLAAMVGTREQAAPAHSAVKVAGRPLYQYARRGIEVDRPVRNIEVRTLVRTGLGEGFLEVEVACSKGTYVRVLAADIGAALGCGAYLVGLRRTATAGFTIDRAVDLATLEAMPEERRSDLLLPVEELVRGLPRVELDPPQAVDILHGRRAAPLPPCPSGLLRLYARGGEFLGLGEVVDAQLVPRRLLRERRTDEAQGGAGPPREDGERA